jgi:hypothetical protein
MSHHMQFLYSLNDDGSVCEIFNGERLMSSLTDTGLCNVVGIKAQGTDCMWADGTLPLALDTCSIDEDGDHTWEPITFAGVTWPGNPAPWWDGVPGSPSSQAYGFWIEEWTGLDSVHMKRNVAQRAGRLGGANFGSLSSQSRVWKLNVILVGENGAALEDLFRWLETTLADCCDPCAGSEMLIRTACPPDGDAGFGLYRAKGTALIEGLQWEAPPIESLGCMLRRVSFTLGVSDPCLYSCATACAIQEQVPNIDDCVPFGLWAGCNISCTDMVPYRICCPVPAAGRGTVSPVVTIENEGAGDSPAMRIYGMSDPLGVGCDPCSLPVCQDIVTTAIPGGSALMVDSSSRRVLFRGPDTGQEWVDGTGFLDPPEGTIPTYLQLSCDPGWVAVEPRALCGDVSSLLISVDIVSRVGCC